MLWLELLMTDTITSHKSFSLRLCVFPNSSDKKENLQLQWSLCPITYTIAIPFTLRVRFTVQHCKGVTCFSRWKSSDQCRKTVSPIQVQFLLFNLRGLGNRGEEMLIISEIYLEGDSSIKLKLSQGYSSKMTLSAYSQVYVSAIIILRGNIFRWWEAFPSEVCLGVCINYLSLFADRSLLFPVASQKHSS